MKNIGIIGVGNMGAAILQGITAKYNAAVCEADKKRIAFLKRKYKITACTLTELVHSSQILIIAVKPQGIEPVLREMAACLTKDKLVISIAAGITSAYIEQSLPAGTKVIRTMPNMPALIGEGMTAISKGRRATSLDVKLALDIFNGVGATVVVKEEMLDAVTAVSGSGPAYVFLFAECLLSAGKKMGLADKVARQLVYQTLSGSAKLLLKSNDPAAQLRAKVTSKGGTTQAALECMLKNKLPRIYEQALKAARKRSRELSKKQEGVNLSN